MHKKARWATQILTKPPKSSSSTLASTWAWAQSSLALLTHSPLLAMLMSAILVDVLLLDMLLDTARP